MKNLIAIPLPDYEKDGVKKSRNQRNKLLLTLALIAFAFKVSAQQPLTVTADATVRPLTQFLGSLPAAASETAHIRSLLKDIQSSVYVSSGEVKIYGENPICLYTDVSSLSAVSTSAFPKSAIEMVTISINTTAELNGAIDLSVFSGFPNLKYIYILSTTAATPIRITRMVSNIDPRFSVFYNIVKAS